MKKTLIALVLVAGLLFSLTPALADTTLYNFTFFNITNNNNEDLSDQLYGVVSSVGDQVAFTFYNDVEIASSITDIYFDDGTLLGIASISSSEGVAFTQPATPGDLPGGNDLTPPFETTQDFSADSNEPVSANGVDAATEWVQIVFDLQDDPDDPQGGQTLTFADTIAALTDKSLRVGLHVQAIGESGGSDSYVNNIPFDPNVNPVVPLPGALVLLGAGLFRLAAYGRRRRNEV